MLQQGNTTVDTWLEIALWSSYRTTLSIVKVYSCSDCSDISVFSFFFFLLFALVKHTLLYTGGFMNEIKVFYDKAHWLVFMVLLICFNLTGIII